MSRVIFRTVAIVTALSVMVPLGAAAQSVGLYQSTRELALGSSVGSELLHVESLRLQTPQQVRIDRTRGALWGGGIGLVAGGVLGGLSVESDDEGDEFGGSLAESAATGQAVLLGAVFGAGIGALLGATVFAPSGQSAAGDGGGVALSVHPTPSMVSVAGRVRIGRPW